MSEQPEAKLTKKQKKALAHRSGSSGGGTDASKKRSAGKARKALRQNIEALPEADLDEGEGQLAENVEPVVAKESKTKKRKRNDETSAQGEEVDGDSSATQQPAKKKPSRQRFICFCGMLLAAQSDLELNVGCDRQSSIHSNSRFDQGSFQGSMWSVYI